LVFLPSAALVQDAKAVHEAEPRDVLLVQAAPVAPDALPAPGVPVARDVLPVPDVLAEQDALPAPDAPSARDAPVVQGELRALTPAQDGLLLPHAPEPPSAGLLQPSQADHDSR
jgi:hypothetical protein